MGILDAPPIIVPGIWVNIRAFLSAPTHLAALNAAMAAAGAGGTVYIPADVTLTLSATATVNSRTIAGPGRITRDSGAGALIDLAGTSPRLEGGLVLRADLASIVNFTGETTGATVEGCNIGSATVDGRPSGVVLNASGIVNARIGKNVISGVGYGILTNVSAVDLIDLKIDANTIEIDVYSDAIELNHPGSPFVGASNVLVTHNRLACTVGSGSASGFGVGIAGASFVTVAVNTFGYCREEGVHVEDEAQHITISHNTFNAPNEGIRLLGGSFIAATGNKIYSPVGSGIVVAQGVDNQATHFTITDNMVSGAGEYGLLIGADDAHYANISGNVIDGAALDGIRYTGTSSGTLYGSSIIESNIAANNGGYGIAVSAHIGARIGGNITPGNASGSYTRLSTPADVLMPINDPTGQGSATIAAGSTGWVDLFPIGVRSIGTLAVTAMRASNSLAHTHALYAIEWDGATLTATRAGLAINNGTASGLEIQVDAGVLQARASISGADDEVAQMWAQLNGTVLL